MKFMLKSILREQGYTEETKYPKENRIAWIWVLSTVSIITGVFTSVLLIKKHADDNKVLDFFFAINQNVKFHLPASVIYVGVWIFALAVLAFIIRNKPGGKAKKVILWTMLMILILLMIFFFILSAAIAVFDTKYENPPFCGFFDVILGMLDSFVPLLGTVILMLVLELIYCAVKLCVSRMFTSNKESMVTIKILKGKGIPVCYNSEAFRVSQIAAMYILPIIFIYSVLYILMMTAAGIYYILICIFMTIFLTFDSTAVIYALFCKAKYKIDYIAFDHHLYESNVFRNKS